MAGVPDSLPAGCILGGDHPCSPECARAGRCVVLRIRLRDASEYAGVPLSIVGETLRFHELRPREAVVLFALDGLEPGSREEVEFRLGGGTRLATRGRPG